MTTRRKFLHRIFRAGMVGSTYPLWSHLSSLRAFAQTGTAGGYKAVVLVNLVGGNDSNNLIVPLDNAEYSAYAAMRTSLALPQNVLNIISSPLLGVSYGLHPSLINVAALFNQQRASIVANIGPLAGPATKAQMIANKDLVPDSLLNHAVGKAQWESATTSATPSLGWGGQMADYLTAQSGVLPPVLDMSGRALFTVGRTVQGIAVQSNGTLAALPTGLDSIVAEIAANDSISSNQLVSQAAQLRVGAIAQQKLIEQAKNSGPRLQTTFPNTAFSASMQALAQVINGRSVTGASRQIFYVEQGLGNYDTHAGQLGGQAFWLSELDAGLGAFMQALQEMGLANQVLVCTHSDFNRTMQANTSAGSDHAWGSHQILLGGGIAGGRVIGSLPALELGGSADYTLEGVWIPTLSVTQLTAGIGSWMGLSMSQINAIYPNLTNFSQGAISLV